MASIPASDSGFARRAVLRLSSIELWERYSFYNMFGLLPLFIAAPVAKGGLGWSGGDALRFFGVYLFSVSVAPLVGGWLSERWLGGRVALRLGMLLLLIGHVLLALAAVIPVSPWLDAQAMRTIVVNTGGTLAHVGPPTSLSGGAATAYSAVTFCFYGAVAFVALGNGLFKPILSVVIGRLPHTSAGERESAFTLFFLFVNIGGLFSLLLGGWLHEVAGWSAAFVAAALGMVVALVVTTLLEARYIRPFVAPSSKSRVVDRDEARPEDQPWLAPMLLLMVFSILAAVASLQSYGFINLFIERSVARGIGGFTVPSSWFVALNPVIIMLVTPILVRGWRQGRLGHDWTTSARFAAGFVVMGLSYCLIYLASLQARTSDAVNPALVLGAIATIALGELFITPTGVAATTRIAPQRFQTVAVGALTAAIGVGGWLSGRVGALALEADTGTVLLGLAGLSLGTGALLVAFRSLLRRFAL